ncbi:hypothetical protein [Rhizobacter sp. P5_C2]
MATNVPSATNVPGSLKSHMFPVPSFASIGHPFLTSSAQAQVQGFREHLDALQGMQAYYAAQRAKAPRGTTTPQVQQEDWKLAAEILNVLTTFSEFQQLPQQLRDSIEALKPLLGQLGQVRYRAWTEMCCILDNGGRPNSLPSSTHGSVGPAAVPPSPPPRATKCETAKRSLMELRDRFDARVIQRGPNPRPSPHEWDELRQHVGDIIASPDMGRHFATSKEYQNLYDLWHYLNQQPASPQDMWGAWIPVKNALPATGT